MFSLNVHKVVYTYIDDNKIAKNCLGITVIPTYLTLIEKIIKIREKSVIREIRIHFIDTAPFVMFTYHQNFNRKNKYQDLLTHITVLYSKFAFDIVVH